jgi:hypothetical protein
LADSAGQVVWEVAAVFSSRQQDLSSLPPIFIA